MSALGVRHELARKAIHLTAIVFPIGYALGVPRRVIVIGLGIVVIIAISLELARLRHGPTGVAFTRLTGSLLREHEQRGLSGATWLALSMLGAAVLLPRDIAIATLWAVAAGDAAAGIIGRVFGRHRFGAFGKSLEGSAACFLVVLAGALMVAHLSLVESIVSAIVAAGAELPSHPFDDNLRIAIMVGSAILLWRIAFS